MFPRHHTSWVCSVSTAVFMSYSGMACAQSLHVVIGPPAPPPSQMFITVKHHKLGQSAQDDQVLHPVSHADNIVHYNIKLDDVLTLVLPNNPAASLLPSNTTTAVPITSDAADHLADLIALLRRDLNDLQASHSITARDACLLTRIRAYYALQPDDQFFKEDGSAMSAPYTTLVARYAQSLKSSCTDYDDAAQKLQSGQPRLTVSCNAYKSTDPTKPIAVALPPYTAAPSAAPSEAGGAAATRSDSPAGTVLVRQADYVAYKTIRAKSQSLVDGLASVTASQQDVDALCMAYKTQFAQDTKAVVALIATKDLYTQTNVELKRLQTLPTQSVATQGAIKQLTLLKQQLKTFRPLGEAASALADIYPDLNTESCFSLYAALRDSEPQLASLNEQFSGDNLRPYHETLAQMQAPADGLSSRVWDLSDDNLQGNLPKLLKEVSHWSHTLWTGMTGPVDFTRYENAFFVLGDHAALATALASQRLSLTPVQAGLIAPPSQEPQPDPVIDVASKGLSDKDSIRLAVKLSQADAQPEVDQAYEFDVQDKPSLQLIAPRQLFNVREVTDPTFAFAGQEKNKPAVTGLITAVTHPFPRNPQLGLGPSLLLGQADSSGVASNLRIGLTITSGNGFQIGFGRSFQNKNFIYITSDKFLRAVFPTALGGSGSGSTR